MSYARRIPHLNLYTASSLFKDHTKSLTPEDPPPSVANENRTGLKGPNIMTNEGPAKDHIKRKSSGSKGRRKIKEKPCGRE